MKLTPARTRALAATVSVLVAAACADRPLSTEATPPPETGPPGTPVHLVSLDCVGDVRAGAVSCGTPAPAETGASAALTVGGQGVYVLLTSSNVNYDAGTGQFTFDVTVQNLIPQALGTTDGTTLDPSGVRVFFHEPPTVTVGTGTAAVVPDGFATFLAAGQAFYQYDELLSPGEVSPARNWTVIVPPTAERFAFKVYVSAPVRYPEGWVEITGPAQLQPPAEQALTATVRTVVGTPVPGAAVTWASSDAGMAVVNPATGMLKAVRAGAVTITASSGVRSGEMLVQVMGVTRSWSGGAGTSDWYTPANWSLGMVPAEADSVLVPTGVGVYPVLTQHTAVAGVTVQDAASLAVAGFDLAVTADVRTLGTGAITGGTGRLVLAGPAGQVAGRLPRTLVTGRYALAGNVVSNAPLEVDGGGVDDGAFQLDIDS